MNAQRAPEPKTAPARNAARKPWKKKTPVEIVLKETDNLRELVATKEEELNGLRRQLHKLEEARKFLEDA